MFHRGILQLTTSNWKNGFTFLQSSCASVTRVSGQHHVTPAPSFPDLLLSAALIAPLAALQLWKPNIFPDELFIYRFLFLYLQKNREKWIEGYFVP